MTDDYLQAVRWAERMIYLERLALLRGTDRPLNPAEIARINVLDKLGYCLRTMKEGGQQEEGEFAPESLPRN